MTDAEKIQFLVDRLFGGSPSWDVPTTWNPNARIEDAFMVVEAMRKRNRKLRFTLYYLLTCWEAHLDDTGVTVYEYSSGETPQAAIVNCAIAALGGKP